MVVVSRFTVVLILWSLLFVALVVINYLVGSGQFGQFVKGATLAQLGQVLTGGTVVLLTTAKFGFALCGCSCCSGDGKYNNRNTNHYTEVPVASSGEEEHGEDEQEPLGAATDNTCSIPNNSTEDNSSAHEEGGGSAPTNATATAGGGEDTTSHHNCSHGNDNLQKSPTTTSADSSAAPRNTRSRKAARSRLVFLDHIKIFLTFMVVTFHVTCSFGGCGPGLWFLIAGVNQRFGFVRWFDYVNTKFALLNQAYFMPLFFAISAYLVPDSYEGNGPRRFFYKKAQRLYIPAMVTSVTLIPATFSWSLYFRGKSIIYFPWPSHCWYLFWLLLLNWGYHTLYQASSSQQQAATFLERSHNEEEDTNRVIELPIQPLSATRVVTVATTTTTTPCTSKRRLFPTTWKRLLCGAFICGALTLIMYALNLGAETWALAPMTVGSVPCDIFMFVMGILARQNGWLDSNPDMHDNNDSATVTNNTNDNDDDDNNNERSCSDNDTEEEKKGGIQSQMDISPWTQRLMVMIEIAVMVVLFTIDLNKGSNLGYAALAFLVSGIYCVDMGLAIVQTFQACSFLNQEMKWTAAFSKAAYTVYLIHPAVVVGATSLYIWGYNLVVGEFSEDRIVFHEHEEEGRGGEDYFWLGWLLVTALSHLVVWPLSWCIATRPMFRNIL